MNPADVQALVRERIDDALKTLADARTLLAAGGSGRSIVNRSYHAMFYAVHALLQTVGQAPRKHQGAISMFDREFVRMGRLPVELSGDLHRLFRNRQVDDYERLGPVSTDEARDALATAERFVEAVRQYLMRAGYLPG